MTHRYKKAKTGEIKQIEIMECPFRQTKTLTLIQTVTGKSTQGGSQPLLMKSKTGLNKIGSNSNCCT